MTTELTQVDGEYQNVAANGTVKDWDADADRWTKGDNDRLYVDGTKFVDYVALDSLIVITQGSGVSATAEIDGDRLTLEVTRDDGINHKEWTAVFALPEDLVEGVGDEAGDDTDGETDDETDEESLVTDGGVDIADYDIDPTAFEYDIRCRTRDSTNSRTNYLGRIEGTDIWVAYRTWQTGPNEFGAAIKGIGRLSVVGTDLDAGPIAETIKERASADIRDNPDADDGANARLEELVDAADEVAANLVHEWQRGSEEVVRDSIHEGLAQVSGGAAWASHVEEAIYHETEMALRDAGVEQDEHGRVFDHARAGLTDAVSARRDHYLRPHLEYEVRLEFDIEPWELRALELEQKSVLSGMRQTARTVALAEESGREQREIAERLDVGPSTVSRHLDRARQALERAEWTHANKPQL